MNDLVPQGMIYNIPLAAVFGLLALVLIVATDVGHRAARLFNMKPSESAAAQFAVVQGGMFGLLALLLAFSFAMAAGRYETRKILVLEEANAVGTAYLRTEFLPPAERGEAKELLKAYVAHRLEFFDAGRDEERLKSAVSSSERLHAELWELAGGAQTAQANNVGIGLWVQSVNEVIDLHEKRLTALSNRVPESILSLLLIVAMTTMLGFGYGTALHGRRVRFPTYLAVALVCAVIVITLDLDRPRRGLIEVSQGSMLRLERDLSDDTANIVPDNNHEDSD